MAAIQTRRRTGIPSIYDANALAYLQATGINPATTYYTGTQWQITGQAMWNATDALIRGLKANNLWNRIMVFYPLLGGTAASHAVNAKNPAAYGLLYKNAPLHGPTGMKFNAFNQLASTGLVVSAMPAGQGYALDYYSADNTAVGGDVIEMGQTVGTDGLFLGVKNMTSAGGKALARAANGGVLPFSTDVVTDTRGFFSVDRNPAGVARLYRNGVAISPDYAMSGIPTNGNVPITIGALGTSGDLNATGYGWTDRGTLLPAARGSYSAAEMATYYALVQAFQTALNRPL